MLRTRFVTAVISLLILGAVLFLVPPVVALLVVGLLVLAGAWEWSGFLQLGTTAWRISYVVLIAALMVVTSLVFPGQADLLLSIACGWWLLAFVWTFFFPTPIPAAVRWACGVLVLIPLFVALQSLYGLDPMLLLLSLLIVWAADMGAYFIGRKYGRVKLAPRISPGKTWEGVFGGLAAVVVLILVWAHFRDMGIAVLLPFCLGVAALSIVGDLTVSMFKRTAGLKDSGNLFPGHGGVLDRIDSVSAAAPLFVIGVKWLELFP